MSHPYSVLLLYPDYLADDYGGETYFAHVTAENPAAAVAAAREEVINVNYPAGEAREDFDADHEPEDFACLLVIAGHHDALDAEDNGRAATPSRPERHPLDSRELATVLAALRLYQQQMNVPYPGAQWMQDIASNCGAVEPLTADEIDELCERLNVVGEDEGSASCPECARSNGPHYDGPCEH